MSLLSIGVKLDKNGDEIFVTQVRQTKKTTIYDLAELAGASASAVSAVLNGNWKKRRISEKLAQKIIRIAEEQNYAPNKQASSLRSNKSKIIGMIVPKYDNRYFGSIVEHFEAMARERGLFPIITCTRRDPSLEIEAAKTMLSYQVDWLIATGATDPDKITQICATSGVPTLNLDLPGTLATSVISDNYSGAKALTSRILHNNQQRQGRLDPLVFIGGRNSDHNTRERLRGFCEAHREYGIEVSEARILTCGYAAEKAENALRDFISTLLPSASNPNNMEPNLKPNIAPNLLPGLFVNSTISLEGVIRWMSKQGYIGKKQPAMGCFDWDPFVALLGHDIEMVKQDVPTMLNAIFELIDSSAQGDNNLTEPNDKAQVRRIEIPPLPINEGTLYCS